VKNRRALVVIGVAAILDVIGGLSFAAVEHLSDGLGIYWAITTATTVGYGDVTPHTGAGHVIAVLVMLSVIPLFAATFSLLTSGLTATHVRKGNSELHEKLDHLIRHTAEVPEFISKEKP
jgi:voltage-gated potassium channel